LTDKQIKNQTQANLRLEWKEIKILTKHSYQTYHSINEMLTFVDRDKYRKERKSLKFYETN